MAAMARENSSLRLTAPMATEPTFNLVFRGYSKREVDQYAHVTEAQLAAAMAERQELAAQVRGLTEQLQRAHTELVELRRRPMANDKLSFRHLGPRIEAILTEAEQQADAIRIAAQESLNKERDEMAAERSRLREEHAKALREFEGAREARRAEDEMEIARRLEAVRVEVSQAQAYARKLRTESEETMSSAQAEYKRLTETANGESEKVKRDANAQAQSVRAKAEQEAAAIAHSAEEYARQTREDAEEQAHQTRAAAEQHAHQTTAAAEQAATQLRTQAEQHAAQVRASAEKHAARLHAAAPSNHNEAPRDSKDMVARDVKEAKDAPVSPVTNANPNGNPDAEAAIQAGTRAFSRD
jgi:cell division septum initiation protein DivIVA